MKLYKDLLSEIANLLEDYSISEVVELRISKIENYDYQINLFIRYRNDENIIEILQKVGEILERSSLVETYEIASSLFINIKINSQKLLPVLANVEENVRIKDTEKIIIDYGGPNIGKPLHVGHLRPLNIGRSIYSINQVVGNQIYSDIHLGDWGMPVAQIITYCIGENIDIKKLSISMLEEIYPKASKKYSIEKEFKLTAQKINKQLTTGQSEINLNWETISKLTLVALKETLNKLGHDFDYWWGESTVNEIIPEMIESLLINNKLEKDGDALISSQITDPRILITKSDGSYLYITTDLATVIFRNKKIPHEKVFYVTDNRQKLHFEQLFKSIEYFEFPKKDYEHIGFGTINDSKGNPLKTRDGGNLKLSDLYDQAYSYIQKINSTLSKEGVDCLTNTVLTFSDLITNRKTDYKFDLEKFTNITGKTGIYVQYAQVRANRLIEAVSQKTSSRNQFNVPLSDLERTLIMQMANIEFYLDLSLKNSEPHHLANYLYELSNQFNALYQDSNIKNIKDINEKNQKIYIVVLFVKYSHLVMRCLGIKPVDKM
ncbi:arginine--tRNA ligase [Acidimicrobiia bacterium]|nr:arginine--tRNA ligase [Acidimicrobiia bacterium]